MMKGTWRKWAALATVLVALLTGSAAFGEDHGACYEAYLQRGLNQQQLTFEEFHSFYADAPLCTPDGGSLVAPQEGHLPGQTR
jgi:hypothetical protein